MAIDLKGQGNEPMLSSSLSDKLREVCTVSHSGCRPWGCWHWHWQWAIDQGCYYDRGMSSQWAVLVDPVVNDSLSGPPSLSGFWASLSSYEKKLLSTLTHLWMFPTLSIRPLILFHWRLETGEANEHVVLVCYKRETTNNESVYSHATLLVLRVTRTGAPVFMLKSYHSVWVRSWPIKSRSRVVELA